MSNNKSFSKKDLGIFLSSEAGNVESLRHTVDDTEMKHFEVRKGGRDGGQERGVKEGRSKRHEERHDFYSTLTNNLPLVTLLLTPPG